MAARYREELREIVEEKYGVRPREGWELLMARLWYERSSFPDDLLPEQPFRTEISSHKSSMKRFEGLQCVNSSNSISGQLGSWMVLAYTSEYDLPAIQSFAFCTLWSFGTVTTCIILEHCIFRKTITVLNIYVITLEHNVT